MLNSRLLTRFASILSVLEEYGIVVARMSMQGMIIAWLTVAAKGRLPRNAKLEYSELVMLVCLMNWGNPNSQINIKTITLLRRRLFLE